MAERIDDLIRQRLLVDGEGCLEDKKITTLTKQMIDWIEDPMKAGLEHDLDKTLGQLELQEYGKYFWRVSEGFSRFFKFD